MYTSLFKMTLVLGYFLACVFLVSCDRSSLGSSRDSQQIDKDLRVALDANDQAVLFFDGEEFIEISEYGVSDSTGRIHLIIEEGSNPLSELQVSFDERRRLVQIKWFNEEEGDAVIQSFAVDKHSGKIVENTEADE